MLILVQYKKGSSNNYCRSLGDKIASKKKNHTKIDPFVYLDKFREI